MLKIIFVFLLGGCPPLPASSDVSLSKRIRCVALVEDENVLNGEPIKTKQTVFLDYCSKYMFECDLRSEAGCNLTCYPEDYNRNHITQVFRKDMKCYED